MPCLNLIDYPAVSKTVVRLIQSKTGLPVAYLGRFFTQGTYHSYVPTGLGPGRVAQSVTCLATYACLTADPGVASSIPARSHTFVEIDHVIISTDILLPSADSFKKGCCQLQAEVCAQITG